MEIVTEPDIRTAEQARRYAEELQLLLRAIGASDADMERGQMRVEANVSLRPRGTEPFGTRVEVKNMNSFRVGRAGDRLRDRAPGGGLDAGEPLIMETRGWSDDARRDLPDAGQGDLGRLPLLPGAGPAAAPRRPGLARRRSRAALPELPAARRARYRDALGLSAVRRGGARRRPGCRRACSRRPLAAGPDLAAEDRRELGHRGVPAASRNAAATAPVAVGRRPSSRRIIAAVADGSISRANGREVLEAHVATGDGRGAIIEARGLRQITRRRRARRRVDDGHRRQPGGRRRLPRRQGPGRRVPRRPGHEGDRAAQANAALVQAAVRDAPGRGTRAEARWAPLNLAPVGRRASS